MSLYTAHSDPSRYNNASILRDQKDAEIPATAFTIQGKQCFAKIIFPKWLSMDLYIHQISPLLSKLLKPQRLYLRIFDGMSYLKRNEIPGSVAYVFVLVHTSDI